MFEQSYCTKKGNFIMIQAETENMDKIKEKSCFLKWDARKSKVALIFMLIGFITLCAFLRFYNFSQYERNDSIKSIVERLPTKSETYSSTVCIPHQCGFTCQNMDGSGLVEAINNVRQNLEDCSNVELILNNVKLNQTLDENWLSGVIPEITILTLINVDINNLERKAFSGKPLTRLRQLTLENTKVVSFRENVFENSTLAELSINYESFIAVEFEENALRHLSKTLQLLQLQRCLDSSSLELLTGSKAPRMAALTRLDIRYNMLDTITETSFSSVPHISTIFLSDSMVRNIDSKSFATNLYLFTLYLEKNAFSYLPEGVFDVFSTQLQQKVYINNNPWNCSCELKWFKEFFKDNAKSLFSFTLFQCLVRGKYENYDEVDFCPQNGNVSSPSTETSPPTKPTTTTPIPTTTTLTTTTPIPTTTSRPNIPINPNFIEVPCVPSNPNSASVITKDLEEPTIIQLRNQTITFQFNQIVNEPIYQILISGNTSNDYLLWIHSAKTDQICKNCYSELNSIIVDNLTFEETYIFCLISKDKSEVTPLDCGGLTVPPEWGSQTWLPNKARNVFIGAVIGTILFCIFLTGLIVFYCIRQHPNLIKGNKRVIIVANKTADALVMPKNYDQLNYMPPSMISYSDGYLIPRRSYYDHVRETPTTEMTSRDSSFRSNSIESENRLKRNVRKRVHLSNVSEKFDGDHLYEAPPLPPNHPAGEFKQIRSANHMVY